MIMKQQTIDFIDHIKNFQIIREVGDDEYTTLKKYYRSKLNACYSYMKALTTMKNGANLKEDYDAILKLSKQLESDFLNWKNNYEKDY